MNNCDFKILYEQNFNTLNEIDSFNVYLVLGGLILTIFMIGINKSKSVDYKKIKFYFLAFCSLFLISLSAILFVHSKKENEIFIESYKNKRTVEGVVNDFVPLHSNGKNHEKFTVNEITFEYSKYVFGFGFKNSEETIKDGDIVKIEFCDFKGDNIIVKLEKCDNQGIGRQTKSNQPHDFSIGANNTGRAGSLFLYTSRLFIYPQ